VLWGAVAGGSWLRWAIVPLAPERARVTRSSGAVEPVRVARHSRPWALHRTLTHRRHPPEWRRGRIGGRALARSEAGPDGRSVLQARCAQDTAAGPVSGWGPGGRRFKFCLPDYWVHGRDAGSLRTPRRQQGRPTNERQARTTRTCPRRIEAVGHPRHVAHRHGDAITGEAAAGSFRLWHLGAAEVLARREHLRHRGVREHRTFR